MVSKPVKQVNMKFESEQSQLCTRFRMAALKEYDGAETRENKTWPQGKLQEFCYHLEGGWLEIEVQNSLANHTKHYPSGNDSSSR